ncbi:hypothetical protein [Lysobacter enzymogenes]|uniref:hypothetical protein n=1 Tax=Lysobacter enzymogenes TaxID=69 RepID=UPI0009421B55|nr:hypothetical protein [Lysobacter enzymogenes]
MDRPDGWCQSLGRAARQLTLDHLHHEQLLNGALQKIKFDGRTIHYYDGRGRYTDYKSANRCP